MNSLPETQLESWKDLQDSLPDKRKQVFELIKNSIDGLALFQITLLLQWPINCVSGRVTELKRSGLIVDSGKREVNPYTNKNAIIWIINENFETAYFKTDQDGQSMFI